MVQRISWTSKISGERLSSEIMIVETWKVMQISIGSRQQKENIIIWRTTQDEKNVPRCTIVWSFPERAHLPKRELSERTADLEMTNTVTSVAKASTLWKVDGSSKWKIRKVSICNRDDMEKTIAQWVIQAKVSGHAGAATTEKEMILRKHNRGSVLTEVQSHQTTILEPM